MAKRKKSSRRNSTAAAPRPKRLPPSAGSGTFLEAAERAVLKQSGKMLVAANKRYKRFVRQAVRATNDANKKKYLAAALTAVVIAGVVATDLKARMDKRPQRAAVRKKRL
jgi:hypothetical protein